MRATCLAHFIHLDCLQQKEMNCWLQARLLYSEEQTPLPTGRKEVLPLEAV
jgi:hypothetical protein